MWEKITPPSRKASQSVPITFCGCRNFAHHILWFFAFLSFPTPQNFGYEWRSKGLTGFLPAASGWDAPRRKNGGM